MKNPIRYPGRALLAVSILLLSLAPLRVAAKVVTPEEYTEQVRAHFAAEEWEEGKVLLDEALEKYPLASYLQYLAGRYWFHEEDYDKSRYHLLKAVDINYDNVDAKKLLVDVEDITQNYSSAICFVNELLEVQPYWRGLWRRKIDLYRKQGNNVEADRLLKRINQIYPQDTVLHKDLVYSMELNYQRQKRGGERKQAIAILEELLKTVPDNEQYYLDIINLHLQEGDQEPGAGMDLARTGRTAGQHHAGLQEGGHPERDGPSSRGDGLHARPDAPRRGNAPRTAPPVQHADARRRTCRTPAGPLCALRHGFRERRP